LPGLEPVIDLIQSISSGIRIDREKSLENFETFLAGGGAQSMQRNRDVDEFGGDRGARRTHIA